MRPKSGKKGGFTLVEVVIALAILAIAFFGMVSVIAYTAKNNSATRERLLASRAAQKKIEQMINSLNVNDLDSCRTGGATEGLGWEQVLETDTTLTPNVVYQALRPVKNPPQFKTPTGFTYPYTAAMANAVVFVRFPLNAAGTAYTQDKSGQFAMNYDLINATAPDTESNRNYIPLDLDGNGENATTGDLTIGQLKILPVIVEVYWSGVGGKMTSLQYRYTFYRKPTITP